MEQYIFRGKRINNGEWVYGFYFEDTEGLSVIQEPRTINTFTVIPETVAQYIGRKDKNGVKIYKGDIIKVKDVYSNLIENHPMPEFIGVVDFQDCSFMIKNDYITAYRWMDYKVEIIGNIYENPELLENIE